MPKQINDTSSQPDRTALSEQLYPTPKSYTQLAAERRRLDSRRDKRIARFTPLGTNLVMTGYLLIAIKSEEFFFGLIELLGAMTGVFSAFFIGLIATAIALWQCIRAKRYFTNNGLPGSWYIGLLIMAGFGALWTYTEVLHEQTMYNLLTILAMYYVVTVTLGILAMNVMLARVKSR